MEATIPNEVLIHWIVQSDIISQVDQLYDLSAALGIPLNRTRRLAEEHKFHIPTLVRSILFEFYDREMELKKRRVSLGMALLGPMETIQCRGVYLDMLWSEGATLFMDVKRKRPEVKQKRKEIELAIVHLVKKLYIDSGQLLDIGLTMDLHKSALRTSSEIRMRSHIVGETAAIIEFFLHCLNKFGTKHFPLQLLNAMKEANLGHSYSELVLKDEKLAVLREEPFSTDPKFK